MLGRLCDLDADGFRQEAAAGREDLLTGAFVVHGLRRSLVMESKIRKIIHDVVMGAFWESLITGLYGDSPPPEVHSCHLRTSTAEVEDSDEKSMPMEMILEQLHRAIDGDWHDPAS